MSNPLDNTPGNYKSRPPLLTALAVRHPVSRAVDHLACLSLMRSREFFSRQSSSRREGPWTVTVNTDNLRALFLARHFLAGLLIGTVIVLAVFLVMG